MSNKTDAKSRSSSNFAYEFTNPLKMVLKHFMHLNRLILMAQLGVRPKLRHWANMNMKQTRKIVLQRIQLLSSQTPYKWEKNMSAMELLNSDV